MKAEREKLKAERDQLTSEEAQAKSLENFRMSFPKQNPGKVQQVGPSPDTEGGRRILWALAHEVLNCGTHDTPKDFPFHNNPGCGNWGCGMRHAHCNRDVRCTICGKRHLRKDCPIRNPVCGHCDGPHEGGICHLIEVGEGDKMKPGTEKWTFGPMGDYWGYCFMPIFREEISNRGRKGE